MQGSGKPVPGAVQAPASGQRPRHPRQRKLLCSSTRFSTGHSEYFVTLLGSLISCTMFGGSRKLFVLGIGLSCSTFMCGMLSERRPCSLSLKFVRSESREGLRKRRNSSLAGPRCCRSHGWSSSTEADGRFTGSRVRHILMKSLPLDDTAWQEASTSSWTSLLLCMVCRSFADSGFQGRNPVTRPKRRMPAENTSAFMSYIGSSSSAIPLKTTSWKTSSAVGLSTTSGAMYSSVPTRKLGRPEFSSVFGLVSMAFVKLVRTSGSLSE
mmetsp:Transcript_29376/g.69996  ORF Transcript_29376/g.69996 Transcript_29376/m.69996 type:complete len:267 (-) Transcript_29376:1051-1851(-)